MVYRNSDEALIKLETLIASSKTFPCVILLDVNISILDKWIFLEDVMKITSSKKVVIYMVFSSLDTVDIQKIISYEEVSGNIIKPVLRENVKEVLQEFQTSQSTELKTN